MELNTAVITHRSHRAPPKSNEMKKGSIKWKHFLHEQNYLKMGLPHSVGRNSI